MRGTGRNRTTATIVRAGRSGQSSTSVVLADEPHEQISISQLCPQARPDLFQQRIAPRLPERVVHFLASVQVDNQDQQWTIVRDRVLRWVLSVLEQQGSIGQTVSVVPRSMRQVSFNLLSRSRPAA